MSATSEFKGTFEGWHIICNYTWQQKLNSTPSCEHKSNLL